MKIKLSRKNKAVLFEAENENRNHVLLDGSTEIGGTDSGMRPMELLLSAHAGCAVLDVVSILKKQRQQLDDVQVEAEGFRKEDGPVKPFSAIHLTFHLWGKIDQAKAEMAVNLAVTKYCSVGSSLNPEIQVTHSTKLHG